jgi:hypothetical protein
MRTKSLCFTTFLVTAGAAAAIGAAPTSVAAPLPKICLPADTADTCQRPGRAETTASVPAESLLPFGTMSHRVGGR